MTRPGEVVTQRRLNYGEGREALLAAAVRVVARGGLRNLTYRAAAKEAGVTHGLVVHHFGAAEREWARMLPRGGRPLARLVFAALDGLVLHQLTFGEQDVTDAALGELRSLLRLLGVAAPADES
ncbi:TetR family transcriptional regulator [Kitasatospora sp. HPMI-4]|uniref:TetR family transcriptional regulator n=1 Tax=Kitasatospora sp. HPMI-4 TaxID=3448443 RepID=UPI003F1C4BA8